MWLSDATRSGLKFTGTGVCVCVHITLCVVVSKLICNAAKAFIEMVEYLFTLRGVKCFLSERISQDPLEKFFGNQRQRGGVNENPTVKKFCQNTQALRVINTVCKDVRGNCRGSKRAREANSLQENTPLKKRKTNRKKLVMSMTKNVCILAESIMFINNAFKLLLKENIFMVYVYMCMCK